MGITKLRKMANICISSTRLSGKKVDKKIHFASLALKLANSIGDENFEN